MNKVDTEKRRKPSQKIKKKFQCAASAVFDFSVSNGNTSTHKRSVALAKEEVSICCL